MSAIFTTQTGEFLTPTWTGPDPVGIAYTESDPAEVTIRSDILRNPSLPKGQRSIDRWFDTAALGPPAPGRFGTSAKSTIKGPGVNVWHMGLHKDFFLNEKGAHLRWEMTATNIFNHPNWSNPGTDITDAANLGVITSTGGVNNGSTGDATGARSFRMGLRFDFSQARREHTGSQLVAHAAALIPHSFLVGRAPRPAADPPVGFRTPKRTGRSRPGPAAAQGRPTLSYLRVGSIRLVYDNRRV